MSGFESMIEESRIFKEEPMKNHTSFRIGGPARYFLLPETEEELKRLLQYCKEENLPCFLLGNGSNLLVSDRGFDGAVIQLYTNYQGVEREGNCLHVKAGTLLSCVAKQAADWGLSGLEFASGIPGTIGGAVFMNAGAYGGEMQQIVSRIKVMNRSGEILFVEKEELRMGYRTSIVKEEGYIVLEVWLALQEKPQADILNKMEELKQARKEKQPLEYPSAGSTFKRPEGYFAGKLIMDAGLRGFRIGDAQVSEKHCGFVVNRGQATAAEVLELITQIQDKVQAEFGVKLELEVQTLGF